MAEPEPPEALASRWVSRLALSDLRIVGAPRPADYRVAAELLEIARSLTPADEPLTRLLLEAHDNAGDDPRVEALTKEVIRLDPFDTVAQLRLITSRLRQLQRVDDRLAAYDRLIGKEGELLDSAIRSRLALDAAMLAREIGDAEGFARRLSRAVELDATNKDAASLALAFFDQRVADPVGRFELMLGVLYADPLDPDTHMQLSRHLASEGAYKGARRFRQIALVIRRNLGVQNTLEEEVEQSVLSWYTDGPRRVIDRYNTLIAEARSNAISRIESAKRAGKPAEGLTDPSQVRLNMSYEWIRLLAAHALGDMDLLRPSLDELVESAGQEIRHLADPALRGENVSEDEAMARARGLREEIVAARLLTGLELGNASRELDVLRADPESDPVKLRRLDALAKLRAGQVDTAAAQLAELGESDDFAQLLLCMAEELRGDAASAAAKYAAFARTHRGTLFGAYGSTRAQRLATSPQPADPTVARLEALAAAVPGWVESMSENPRRFQTLAVSVEPLEARMFDDVRLTVTLRNVGPVPIGVGPDRPINSRFLIAPNLQIATEPVATSSLLQVASLDRRLRLNPREEFRVTLSPDVGQLGVLLDQVNNRPARVRYRVLQGFEMLPTGAYDAGPYCLSAEAGPVLRPVSNKANADVATLMRWVQSGTPRELAEALMLVRARDTGLTDLEPISADDQRRLYAEVAARFPALETHWQLTVLCVAPTGVQSALLMPMQERATQPLDDAARLVSTPEVRTLVLALRTDKPDDPILDPAQYQDKPVLAELAQIVRSRLQDQTPCYATLAPVGRAPAQADAPRKDGAGSLAQPTDR
ncbi:MAG: hypothetical protein ACK4WH_08995 [Phycisphaerales bacterium]